MPLFWLILPLLAVIAFLRRPDLRREMLWAGVLSLPVLLIQPLLSTGLHLGVSSELVFLAQQALIAFSLGGLAAALYKVLLHKRLTPQVHPLRGRLRWLWAGPVLLAVFLVLKIHFAPALFASLGIEGAILLALRPDLIWDFITSGLGMGVLYAAIFWLTASSLPGDVHGLWFGDSLSGLTLFSLPIEEVLAVALFGALWGPLYAAVREVGEVSEPAFRRESLRPKKLISGIIFLVAVVGLGWFCDAFIFLPKVSAASPADTQIGVPLGSQLSITLTRPINRKKITFQIEPPVEGSWHFENASVGKHLYTTAVFVPERYFEPNQEYVVTLAGISNIYGVGSDTYTYRFRTQPVPTMQRASLADNATNVPICTPLTAYLDEPNSRLADFTFRLDPPVDLMATLNADQTAYTLTPKKCLAQGQAYVLSAERSLTIYDAAGNLAVRSPVSSVYSLHFMTKPAPGIASTTPQGSGLAPTQVKKLTITFAQQMSSADPTPYLSITPPLAGKWQWADSKTLNYLPSETPAFAATYTVAIKQGLPDAQHGYLAEDVSYSFTTLGPVRVSRIYPPNGATGIAVTTTVSVTFDQPVDHASAEAAFSLQPTASGSFSWDGQVLSYRATLQQGTSYRLAMAAGVKSLIGQNSVAAASSSFSTELPITLLSIPVDYQDKALSCEVASLKMALNYRGAGVTEDDLMNKIGYDPTPHVGDVWGDPSVAFVGSINGRQDTTGYGVYWGPVAKAASAYRSAQAFSGWSASQVAHQLADGNPVVFWGIWPGGYYDPWVTSDGKTVQAWKGEHVRLLVGFVGSPDNPQQFIVNDPIAGRLYWSTSQFLANWSTFGDSGVVVY